jgi:hypothetical protein
VPPLEPRNTTHLEFIKFVYRGWIGFINIGDDIVIDVLFKLLAGSLHRQLPVLTGISFVVNDREAIATPFAEHDLFVLGGGSLLHPDYMPFVRDGLAADGPVYLHGTGCQYDVSLKNMISVGMNASGMLGGTRGPISQARVLAELNSTVPVVYDSALAALELFGANASSATAALIANKRQALDGNLKVAVIVGIYVRNMTEWSSEFRIKALEFFEAWADVCARLSSGDGQDAAAVVVLLDLDGFAAPQNQIVLERCLALGGVASNVHHARFTQKWPNLLATLQTADITLGIRLHSGILSAAVGTPFAFFPSPGTQAVQMKYNDFERSVGWSTAELFGAARVDADYARHVLRVAHDRGAELGASLREHAVRCLRAHTMASDRAVAEVLQRRSDRATTLLHTTHGNRSLAFECSQDVQRGLLSCVGGVVETQRRRD